MEAAVLRGRRWFLAWAAFLLLLTAVTRLAVVFIAVNGREGLPAQLLSDALVVVVLLWIADGDGLARWFGVVWFAGWGLSSLLVATVLGAVVTFTFTPRADAVFLLADGTWGTVVQALGALNGAGYLGFATALAVSPSINRYLVYRRGGPA